MYNVFTYTDGGITWGTGGTEKWLPFGYTINGLTIDTYRTDIYIDQIHAVTTLRNTVKEREKLRWNKKRRRKH